MTVLIVGAGIVGLCSARFLLEEGVRDVTVVEGAQAAGLGTSFANGALMHPSAVEPWNSPGILGHVLRHLGREDASVLLRLRAVPSLLGWGLHFVRESAPARFRANALANTALALHSLRCMDRIRRDDTSFDRHAGGSLLVCRDRASLQATLEWGEVLAGAGVAQRVLDVDGLVAAEPALAPIAHRLAGGIHNLDDVSGDCHRFCLDLVAQLQAAGVRLRFGEPISSLVKTGDRVSGVRLATGEGLAADAVVLAAGPHSVQLAAGAGLRLPVRPAKGYSLTYELGAHDAQGGLAPTSPRLPVIDRSLHVAMTPLGAGHVRRLRVAGTAEFCGDDLRIQPERTANLERLAAQVYPSLLQAPGAASPRAWAGLRPMCADGRPLIGPTRLGGLYLNTGHGHLGWTVAAASGELLARLLARPSTGSQTGTPDGPRAADFAPSRFGL